MPQKLRVGIAGYGVVGKRRFEIIKTHPQLTTVAVCDRHFKDGLWPSTEKTKLLNGEGKLDEEIKYFQDHKELLKENLDILFVCLTNDIAAEVTMAGLEAGLHVFCEKPPGRNLKEVNQVIECEKRHPNLKLKYGFNHRYHDSVRDAMHIMEKGEFGKVINLRGIYGKSKLVTFDQSDWRTHRDVAGGGVLLDQGIHMVDLLRLFGGEFTEVHSFVCNDFWNYDVEDNAFVLMRNKKGVVASLHSTATQWQHKFSMEITFQHGYIDLKGILSGTKSYGKESITIISKHDVKKNEEGKKFFFSKDNSWKDEVDEFAKLIFYKRKKYVGNIYEAENVMFTLDKIYRSDKKWFKYLKKNEF